MKIGPLNVYSPLTILTMLNSIQTNFGLNCYVCTSFNGSNPLCEDPFHTNTTTSADYYTKKLCMGYRKDRSGYFPADHCIKISGKSTVDSNYTVMMRTCSLDSGTLTADTEIVRMSHCGHFSYNDHYFSGCVQSCAINGCNTAESALHYNSNMATATSILLATLIRILILGAR